MSIIKDIHSLEPGAIVELFDLDLTPIDPAAGVLRFHAGTNELNQPVVWQGHTYEPRPVEATGFGVTTTGTAPRPKMQVSNIPTFGPVGFMTLLNRDYSDLVGAIVTRRRTLVKYLDAANFRTGVNPDADPTVEFPLDVYHVERRVTENRTYVEYELSSIYDLEAVNLPTEQVIRDSCTYTYRLWDPTASDFIHDDNFDDDNDPSTPGVFKYVDPRGIPIDCPYTGSAYFDALGGQLTDPAQDVCGRRMSDCRLRFAAGTRTLDNVATGSDTSTSVEASVLPPGGVLPFGGFPGARRY